jgi:diguanylate cyclase (GGDEF)-like protein
MPLDLSIPPPRSSVLDWALGTLGILGIGALDYLTGNEMRVFPLYYVPLAILAWSGGRTGAAVATLLCGGSWVASNLLAGLEYSLTATWYVNTGMQTLSFATVGLLIAVVRNSFLREQELARTDSLTGLANRKGFYEEAVRLTALCRRSGRPITAGYIDLDNFKAANDELGHEKGDHVLRSAADALLAAVRPSDVAARVGGDEFIVLLPEVDAQEAVAALERIRASLSEALPQEPVHVSASIGGVTFTVAPESIDDIVGAADAQMYAAKSQGRNRVALYTFPGRETTSDSTKRRRNGPSGTSSA